LELGRLSCQRQRWVDRAVDGLGLSTLGVEVREVVEAGTVGNENYLLEGGIGLAIDFGVNIGVEGKMDLVVKLGTNLGERKVGVELVVGLVVEFEIHHTAEAASLAVLAQQWAVKLLASELYPHLSVQSNLAVAAQPGGCGMHLV
jgi:hypothetical protein